MKFRRRALGLAACAVVIPCVSATGSTGASQLTAFHGVWQMRGYGRIFDVSAGRVVRYDVTDISCLVAEEFTPEQAAEEYDRIDSSGDRLGFFATGGITRYTLDRIGAPPDQCRNSSSAPLADPVLNFWVMWHAIRQHYAFFDLRGADWNAAYARFRPMVDASTSEEQLFEIFCSMLRALNDMHVELKAGRRTFFTNGPVEELKRIWLAGQPGKAWEATESAYKSAVREFIHQDVLHGKGHDGAQGTINWGWAAPGIGYINVGAMYLEPPPNPDGSPREPYPLPDEIAQVDAAMTRALQHLHGARAMIVDARFNDGGADAFGLRIMGYFTRERHRAFTKQAVSGAGQLTEAQQVYIEPVASRPYTGPVFYLQSGSTISAAEIFSLAMMALPTATSIGTRTYGVLSDVLSKNLPNGWKVGLSNEVYTAVDGEVYEGRGIPPEIEVPVPANISFAHRLRLDIDMALALARKGSSR